MSARANPAPSTSHQYSEDIRCQHRDEATKRERDIATQKHALTVVRTCSTLSLYCLFSRYHQQLPSTTWPCQISTTPRPIARSGTTPSKLPLRTRYHDLMPGRTEEEMQSYCVRKVQRKSVDYGMPFHGSDCHSSPPLALVNQCRRWG
jgi:hypothetical protein